MKKEHFDGLLKSIREAGAYARGEHVPGLRVHSRTIGQNDVVDVRLRTGLTQAQFAEIVGTSLGTVRRWETGERTPSGPAATLIRVLEYDPALVMKALGVKSRLATRAPRTRSSRDEAA